MNIYLQKKVVLLVLFFLVTLSCGSQIISTYAGNRKLGLGFSGDGGLATNAQLFTPLGVVVDKFGNVFIADAQNNRIRKIDAATNIISTYAGNGADGYSGDNGPATAASLNSPSGLAVDTFGNLYIADFSFTVRKVDVNNHLISTVAGNGTQGYSGDGGLATNAEINFAQSVFVDKDGSIYIVDYNNGCIRKVDANSHIISTYAGDGTVGFKGDGGLATFAEFNYPNNITGDALGNIYITDTYNNRIRKIDKSSGIISTIVGNGLSGYTGDNGPALSAEIGNPLSVAIDRLGDVFIASQNNVVRKVDVASGNISTVAGNGVAGFLGDGESSVLAELSSPASIALDAKNNIFICDQNNDRIRRIDASTNKISTYAGNYIAFGGDNDNVTSAVFNHPEDIAFDKNGNLYISDAGNNRIRKVDASTQIVTTVVGDGIKDGTIKDSIPADSAEIGSPQGIVTDPAGNVFFADYVHTMIRKLDVSDNKVYIIAGNGSSHGGLTQDNNNIPAKNAFLDRVQGLKFDTQGNLYFVDPFASVVYRIDAESQLINIIAGNGNWGSSGDGGQATQAFLYFPFDVATDKTGNVYIADGNQKIRKVDALTHIITTFAGNGQSGYSGDGGLAVDATIGPVSKILIDSVGNLFISCNSNVIRRIDAKTNIITTVAGTGIQGFSGDGDLATKAELYSPQGINFDKKGNLFLADDFNNVIRKISNATLPVTLTSFTAIKSGKGSLLSWQTTSEINSAFFQIERMGEQGGFSDIGKVDAADNSVQMQKYSFEDQSPLQGVNYYRLKEVDKDGKFNYSNIESLDFSTPFLLKLYPNPAQNTLVIEGLDNQTKTNISVIDMLGKTVSTVAVTASKYAMDVKQLPAGNYYLLLKTNIKVSALKFVKE